MKLRHLLLGGLLGLSGCNSEDKFSVDIGTGKIDYERFMSPNLFRTYDCRLTFADMNNNIKVYYDHNCNGTVDSVTINSQFYEGFYLVNTLGIDQSKLDDQYKGLKADAFTMRKVQIQNELGL